MQCKILEVQKDLAHTELYGICNTDCIIPQKMKRGKSLRLETIGGVLITEPLVDIKKSKKGILRIDTQDNLRFYLRPYDEGGRSYGRE